MNKRKFLLIFFLIITLMFGVSTNSYADNDENIENDIVQPEETQEPTEENNNDEKSESEETTNADDNSTENGENENNVEESSETNDNTSSDVQNEKNEETQPDTNKNDSVNTNVQSNKTESSGESISDDDLIEWLKSFFDLYGVEKYKTVLDIQKSGKYPNLTPPASNKMPRTGMETNPLLIGSYVCFASAALGIMILLITSKKSKK